MSFNLGDVVMLKSGSGGGAPWMTVNKLNVDNKPGDIECQWYSAKDGAYKTRVFREEVLKLKGNTPRPRVT